MVIIGHAKVTAPALATDLSNSVVMSGGLSQDWYFHHDRFAELIEECGDLVAVIQDGEELALMFSDGTFYRNPGKHAYRMIVDAPAAAAETCGEPTGKSVAAPVQHNGRVAYIVEVSRSPAGRAASAVLLRVEDLEVLPHGAVRYDIAVVGETRRFRGLNAVSEANAAAHSMAAADAAWQWAVRAYIVGFGSTVAEIVRRWRSEDAQAEPADANSDAEPGLSRWQSFGLRHGMAAGDVVGPLSVLSQRYLARRDRMAQAVEAFASASVDALCWAQNPETYATCGTLVPGPDGPETLRRGGEALLPPPAKPRVRRANGAKRLSTHRSTLTCEIAIAATHSAGDRSMRMAGQTVWSDGA